jgi:hypothetical protein
MEITTKFNVGDIAYYLSCNNIEKGKIEKIMVTAEDENYSLGNKKGEVNIKILYKLDSHGPYLNQNEIFHNFEDFKNNFQPKFSEPLGEKQTSNTKPNKIDLGINRDGAHLWFEKIKDDIYELKTDKQYVLEYCRIGTTDAEVTMVDPSGGPYINVGEVFDDYKLTSIFYEDKNLRFELK